jgi:GNAT superfamily N-acetyltransferase
LEIFVLYVDGSPAGYVEWDKKEGNKEVELCYLGIIPDFVGRSLGPTLLQWTIDQVRGVNYSQNDR